jgi:hypothetical protein
MDANSNKDARHSIEVQGSPKKLVIYYEIKKHSKQINMVNINAQKA